MGLSQPGADDRSFLEPAAVERGAQLLHAQCWLWGQDLRSPHGNLLEAVGLEGAIFEGAQSHRRYYRVRLASSRFVVAWGGGVLFGDDGGSLFFPRLQFGPRRLGEVRSLEAMPDLNRVEKSATPLGIHERDQVTGALDWLASYEDAMRAHAGDGWRVECARLWSEIEAGAEAAARSVGVTYAQLPPLPADGLAASWRGLGRAIALGSGAGGTVDRVRRVSDP